MLWTNVKCAVANVLRKDSGVVVLVIVVAVINTGPWTRNAKPTSETNKQWAERHLPGRQHYGRGRRTGE